MKRTSILLCFFVAFLTLAFNTKKISVTFIPDKNENIESCILVFNKNGQTEKITGTLENGKFIFEVEVDGYQKATISCLVNNNGKKASKHQPFILEPGNIIIDKSSGNTNYSGTPFQEELNKFYQLSQNAWTKYFPNQTSVDLGDPVTKETYNNFLKEKNLIWEQYFESNKNPFITAFNLENYVTSSWVNLDKAAYYYNKLDESIRSLPDVKEFGQRLLNQSALLPGKVSPSFTLPDATGKTVSLKDFKGKYVLIDFWASWCKPCREESPVLVAAYQKYKQKNFEILSVSFDDTNLYDAWLTAVKKDGYTWTNLIDTDGMSKSEVAKLFNVKSIPRNLLLDKNGIIVAINLRGEELEKQLKDLL